MHLSAPVRSPWAESGAENGLEVGEDIPYSDVFSSIQAVAIDPY